MEEITTTYRLVALGSRDVFGHTALTPEMAKLVPGDLITVDRESTRLGIERTDWGDHYGKPRAIRTVLIEVEDRPDSWEIGT